LNNLMGRVMGVAGEPAAFMSYVRFNDQHDDGQLTQFRERLGTEVRAQTGEEFAIFQDRNDIAWGQNWQQRIDETLDVVTLLLVIITPSLFHSPACRAEVKRFLDRERALRRADLILPVYYIDAREMDDPELRERDEMAKVLASRQYADWRELRFEAFTSPQVRKAIAQLASRMRDTFWQPTVAPIGFTGRLQAAGSLTASAKPVDNTDQVTAKTAPPTHVVDAYHRGDFATVSAAIRKANPGDRILVRPGLYEEGLVIDKPLEILGDGPVSDIEIRANGVHVLLFKATIGRFANMTLRQTGKGERSHCVDIRQGRLDLEGCDISSQNSPCVVIGKAADPRLRRNLIHDSLSAGIAVFDGLGTVEDNEITAVTVGVQIAGNTTLRRNQIHDNVGGILFLDGGLGTAEDNDITSHEQAGVEIRGGANPTLRRNQIRSGKASGAFVHKGGLGRLEDNEIVGNALAGVEITTSGNPTLRNNRVKHNRWAVSVYAGGHAIIVDNDVTENKEGPWKIGKDCEKNVARTRNKE
jgi:F-box protein 11